MQERFHATDPDKQAKQLDDFAQQGMEMFVEYMYEHFEEFKLLVNGSYGTKFQNFVEHLVDIETECPKKRLKNMWSCWKNITAPDGTLYTKKAVNHRCIIEHQRMRSCHMKCRMVQQ